ncbi:hypothetical protein V2J09_017679 [Rumex salicifolius]
MGSLSPSHLYLLTLFLSFFACFAHDDNDASSSSAIHSLTLTNQVLEIRPSPLDGYKSDRGPRDAISCDRVHVIGITRLKLRTYASSTRLTLAPSVVIPEKLHSKIQICSHRNISLQLCCCEKDDWKSIQKGIWSSTLSPYEDRYIDVKFIGDISGHVTLTAEEEFQNWRLICLVIGFMLLLVAPIVSSYVPFYYGSSMLIGVLLVILILLFQGMKLLPTGRKSMFYISVYGSVIGAGSFIIRYFSMMVNSVLVNFGLTEEMHNPVSIFLLVGIALAGAALGFYIVRRFVISDDGCVDIGVAQFVKWAMRIVASTFILQGSSDTLLSLVTLLFCSVFCSFFRKMIKTCQASRQSRRLTPARNRPEFLSKPGKTQMKLWYSPCKASPVKCDWSFERSVLVWCAARNGPSPEYYSTFHKVSNRRKMSRKAWEAFTKESTREAMAGLATSPEFTDWVMKNADRIQLHPEESSDEDQVVESESESSEETTEQSGNRQGGFKRYM